MSLIFKNQFHGIIIFFYFIRASFIRSLFIRLSFMQNNIYNFADSVDMKDVSSMKQSDLFSSTAGLSGRTTDSWLEGDDLPFVIYPETGTISAGQSVECTLKFSPKDVFYYKAYLTCKYESNKTMSSISFFYKATVLKFSMLLINLILPKFPFYFIIELNMYLFSLHINYFPLTEPALSYFAIY